jgi:hypothetical protein
LAKSYGLRDIANLEYYRRAMSRGAERFIQVQETLFDLYERPEGVIEEAAK